VIEKGNIVGIQGIGRDITERKKLEQELVQTDKLASLGQLVAGIAHEINNPIAVIAQYPVDINRKFYKAVFPINLLWHTLSRKR